MQRGVITTAAEITALPNGISYKYMSPEMLRYYALYWDKIVVTDSRLMRINPSPEMVVLEQAGILRRERADFAFYGVGPFPGQDQANLHHMATADVASALAKTNPGQWTIHQEGNFLAVPSDLEAEKVTAEIQLVNCLSVPNADFPLDKLLEFKMNREAELAAFRNHVDELYLYVVGAGDIDRASVMQIEKLKQSIKDLNTVSNESWGINLMGNRRVFLEIDAATLSSGAKQGSKIGSEFAGPLGSLVGGAIGAVAATIKIEYNNTKQVNLPASQNGELAYLASLYNEGIVTKKS